VYLPCELLVQPETISANTAAATAIHRMSFIIVLTEIFFQFFATEGTEKHRDKNLTIKSFMVNMFVIFHGLTASDRTTQTL
jgi:hypothetical protein